MTAAPHGDLAWREALSRVLACGERVSPRGMETRELLHSNLIRIDMSRAVVTSPERRLNYRFQCAEALWILSGDDRLEPLARYVPRMSNFSDDGVTLAGAYGPRVVSQLPWVVDQLLRDRDTRQVVLTIWERTPKPSKDVPCTVAMSFSIRSGQLHQHVFMRSSDVWMGVPYDMFSFSCIGLKVACEYNRRRDLLETVGSGAPGPITPGVLSIAATSSHVYARDFEDVERVLSSPQPEPVAPVPTDRVLSGDWKNLEIDIGVIRDGLGDGTYWTPRPPRRAR